MSAFILKIIALTTMLIDHVGAVSAGHIPFYFRIIGRLAFPIFVYLIAEGFRHTRNPKKFLLRLFIFAIISEPFFDWSVGRWRNYLAGYSPWTVDFIRNTNIFYTLFLGGLAIVVFQHLYEMLYSRLTLWGSAESVGRSTYVISRQKRFMTKMYAHMPNIVSVLLAALPVFIFMFAADTLTSDYGGYGVLFIFLMYVVSPKKLPPQGGEDEEAFDSSNELSQRRRSLFPNKRFTIMPLLVFTIMNLFQHRSFLTRVMQYGTRDSDSQMFGLVFATLLTVPLIALYNGRRGPSFKLFFYIAYPAHLFILAILAYVITF